MLSLLALLHVSSAFAQDNVLHPQVNFTLEGSRTLTDTLSLRGSGQVFWTPGADEGETLVFVYVGPKFALTDWYTIAPQVGTAVNWTGEGDLQPLFSTWNWIGSHRLRAFIETDLYLSLEDGTPTYFGVYSVDYGTKLVEFGPQVEQVNTAFSIGGHVGLPLGDHLYLHAAYFRELADDTNMLRWSLTAAL
jgi:hypothetical protein